MTAEHLLTVKEIVDNPAIPFGANEMKHFLFKRDQNGLAKAVVKIGRRVYIDKRKFDDWIEEHREAPEPTEKEHAKRNRRNR